MEIPTEGSLCWDFFLGGALVSSAPTAQKCIVYFVEGVSKLNQCGLKAQQPHSPGQRPGC